MWTFIEEPVHALQQDEQALGAAPACDLADGCGHVAEKG